MLVLWCLGAQAVAEVPGIFLAMYALDLERVGRKGSLVTAFTVSCLSMLMLMLLFDSGPSTRKVLASAGACSDPLRLARVCRCVLRLLTPCSCLHAKRRAEIVADRPLCRVCKISSRCCHKRTTACQGREPALGGGRLCTLNINHI